MIRPRSATESGLFFTGQVRLLNWTIEIGQIKHHARFAVRSTLLYLVHTYGNQHYFTQPQNKEKIWIVVIDQDTILPVGTLGSMVDSSS